MLGRIIKDCLSERNNKTWDVVRVLGTIGFFTYLLLSTIELFRHCSDFSLTDMATGIGIILGVVAAGVTLKFTKER